METRRLFFFSLGATLFGIGAIGAILPVVPTTPFILASFFCFGKSSKRAEKWISNNRYFNSFIENYKTNKGVPLDIKIKSIVFLWITLIISSIIFLESFYSLLLMVVGISVTVHILLLKTERRNPINN